MNGMMKVCFQLQFLHRRPYITQRQKQPQQQLAHL